jgi:3-hydroxyisobutyrate dehydrogenase
MLPNSDIVEAVLLDEGLLDRMAPGSVLIDMSSSDARRTLALGPKVAEREIDFADAPVSGGVARARTGELTVIVGAEEDVLERIEPLLRTMAANVFRVGGLGSGHAAKALNNLLSATGLLISVEAVEAGRRFGIDPETLLELLNVSTGMNHATKTKIDRYVLSGNFDSGFRAELMLKDLRLARAIVADAGLGTGLADAVVEQWAAANAQLPAGADQTEIHHVTAGEAPAKEEAR